MGGKSSSSSSNSTRYETNYTTDVNDSRGMFESGSIGLTGGGELNVTTTDLGAIEGAKEFAVEAMGFASEVSGQSTDLAELTIKESMKVLAEGVEDNAKEIAETSIKWLLTAGVSAVAIYAWMKRK